MNTVSVLTLFAVLVSACGGADDEAVGPSADSAVTSAVPDADTSITLAAEVANDDQGDAAEDDEPVETVPAIHALEAEWAARRAEQVGEITTLGWGVDEENVLSGPGRWEVDLDRCPRRWSDTAGLETGRIVLAQTLAQTGNQGLYGDFGVGMKIYFDYVNSIGGIDGKQIEYRQLDDEYIASKTIEAVDDLLRDEEEPFAITTLGTPNSLAVYGDINDACIPHPFVMSGHPAFGDPDEHPWSTTSQLAFSTEAILWGRWLQEQYADELPLTVAALVIDNDFGQVYEGAFEQWASANRDVVSEVVAVRHEPGTANVVEEMDELAEASPDVFIAMTTGNACLSAVRESERVGFVASTLVRFTPSVCKDSGRYLQPAGAAAAEVMVVGGGLKSTTDPQFASEPFIAFVNNLISEAGLDPSNAVVGTGGAFFAWSHVEALRLAADLPGGLTRSNLLLATRAMVVTHPMLLDGISFGTEGSRDAFFVEGSDFSAFDLEADSWVKVGRTVDINGFTPNCQWGRKGCS